jgi:cobaltochelatase CobS
MADIKSLLEEFKQEKLEEQNKIQTQIEEEFKKQRITFENLDKDLQKTIMTKQNTSGGGGTPPTNPNDGMPTPKAGDLVIDDLFQKVYDDLMAKNNVYLYGKAGTGKTELAKAVAKYMNVGEKDNYRILNCSQWTSPMQIIGGFSIRGYQEGELELVWKYGGVLILDELPKLDPNTAGLLNDALSQTADSDERSPTITSGRGEKIPKNKHFYVIGAGNTDMKSVGANFSGNNRQDYSLVDRFTGSFYLVGRNKALEERLTYKAVLNLSNGLRNFLELTEDSVEAITLRSMLNFNRTYEQEMLRELRSKLAFKPAGTSNMPDAVAYTMGKTLKDSVDSFIDSLGKDRATNLRLKAEFTALQTNNVVDIEEILKQAKEEISLFREEFLRLYGISIADREKQVESKKK